MLANMTRGEWSEKEGTKSIPERTKGNVLIPDLVIHNSFDLLNREFEIPSGEALLDGQDDQNTFSHDVQYAISKSVLEASKEKTCLVVGETSEAPLSHEARPSKDHFYNTDLQVFTPIPMPMTLNYGLLSADKRPIRRDIEPTTFILNAAIDKSVNILKKFWGDEVEEDIEDPTFVSVLSETSSKHCRKKKKKNSPTYVIGNSSNGITTRYKTGNSKPKSLV